jgi:TonB family protein
MTPSAVFLPLILLVTCVAQDTSPPCRGIDGDASGCRTPPRAIYAPDPKYPKLEGEVGHEGTVILSLIVGADGVPRDIKVSGPLSREFDEAAMEAVKKWKFSPATKDGKPVAVKAQVQVKFHRPR